MGGGGGGAEGEGAGGRGRGRGRAAGRGGPGGRGQTREARAQLFEENKKRMFLQRSRGFGELFKTKLAERSAGEKAESSALSSLLQRPVDVGGAADGTGVVEAGAAGAAGGVARGRGRGRGRQVAQKKVKKPQRAQSLTSTLIREDKLAARAALPEVEIPATGISVKDLAERMRKTEQVVLRSLRGLGEFQFKASGGAKGGRKGRGRGRGRKAQQPGAEMDVQLMSPEVAELVAEDLEVRRRVLTTTNPNPLRLRVAPVNACSSAADLNVDYSRQ